MTVTKLKISIMLMVSLLLGLLLGVFIGMGYLLSLFGEAQSVGEDISQKSLNNQPTVTQVTELDNKTGLKDDVTSIIRQGETDQNQESLKIENLQFKLKNLSMALDRVTAEKHQLEKQIASNEQPIEIEITEEQANQYLPEPFNHALKGKKGLLAENFHHFIEEDIDYSWNQEMEINIKQYITLHKQSYYIELDSVRCKSSTCEIRGFEKAPAAWQAIMVEMLNQDWWNFNSSSSVSSNTAVSSAESNDSTQNYFYLLASK